MAVACFRGRATVSVLVSKPECHVLQEKLRAARARAQPAEPSPAAVDAGAEAAAAADGGAGVMVEPAEQVAHAGDKRPAEEAAAEDVPCKRAAL